MKKKYPIKILGGLILGGIYPDIPPVATPLVSNTPNLNLCECPDTHATPVVAAHVTKSSAKFAIYGRVL